MSRRIWNEEAEADRRSILDAVGDLIWSPFFCGLLLGLVLGIAIWGTR